MDPVQFREEDRRYNRRKAIDVAFFAFTAALYFWIGPLGGIVGVFVWFIYHAMQVKKDEKTG